MNQHHNSHLHSRAEEPRRSFPEEEIEQLTRETSQLIRTADRKRREELREYALNRLREETAPNRLDNDLPAYLRNAAPFNPLVLALPLLFMGGLLLFLSPPLGSLLLGVAVLLGSWGILRPLLYHRRKT